MTHKIWGYNSEIILDDFENTTINESLNTFKSKVELDSKEATRGKQSLKVFFKGDEKESGFVIAPKTPWSIDPNKKYCLVYDAKSLNGESSFITVEVENDK
ncbi:agarase, partial [Halomonas marinisediminis]